MKITILSDAGSWKNDAIAAMAGRLVRKGHRVACLHAAEKVKAGDILFILGFFKIVPPKVLSRSKINLVVHESALPKGRGWSPATWLVLEGAREIPLTLFEAVEKVDAGKIFLRGKVRLAGHELLPEIRAKTSRAIMALCEKFVRGYPGILRRGTTQTGRSTYYPRRRPADSRLDPGQSIARQFNRLRVADNEAYPNFFTHRGSTYVLKIEKKKE
jgi:methionyl-tRNA formyltransferase